MAHPTQKGQIMIRSKLTVGIEACVTAGIALWCLVCAMAYFVDGSSSGLVQFASETYARAKQFPFASGAIATARAVELKQAAAASSIETAQGRKHAPKAVGSMPKRSTPSLAAL